MPNYDKRLVQLSTDVWDFVFNMLDNEIEFTTHDCGKIATKVEQVFLKLVRE